MHFIIPGMSKWLETLTINNISRYGNPEENGRYMHWDHEILPNPWAQGGNSLRDYSRTHARYRYCREKEIPTPRSDWRQFLSAVGVLLVHFIRSDSRTHAHVARGWCCMFKLSSPPLFQSDSQITHFLIGGDYSQLVSTRLL